MILRRENCSLRKDFRAGEQISSQSILILVYVLSVFVTIFLFSYFDF